MLGNCLSTIGRNKKIRIIFKYRRIFKFDGINRGGGNLGISVTEQMSLK